GYQRVLQEISDNPTSNELIGGLDKWFGSSVREGSDWIVFYYTGHGTRDGDTLFLLTRNSEEGLEASTSVSAEQLAQVLVGNNKGGNQRRVKNCLLILDTCYSGAGAFDVIGTLRKFFEEGKEGLFYVLSAALPKNEAMAGALARALTE